MCLNRIAMHPRSQLFHASAVEATYTPSAEGITAGLPFAQIHHGLPKRLTQYVIGSTPLTRLTPLKERPNALPNTPRPSLPLMSAWWLISSAPLPCYDLSASRHQCRQTCPRRMDQCPSFLGTSEHRICHTCRAANKPAFGPTTLPFELLSLRF